MPFDFAAVSDILACPECHGSLFAVDDALICACSDDRKLKFPVVDGIPRLLVDEATELTQEQWDALRQRAKSH